MANGFGSLYIGASGLQNSQNALNTTSNNLANVNTKGYVRQQVLQVDRNYTTFNTTASISQQQIIHCIMMRSMKKVLGWQD